jgi:two-component system response regulator
MASARKSKCLVLLVEDSDDDALLVEMAFEHLEWFSLVARVPDGHHAIAYLKGEGIYSDRRRNPFPDLILLDLRMPRVDGFAVLQWLQSRQFDQLQTIVLSGSEYPLDMREALRLGADFYRTKPLRLSRQVSMLKALEKRVLQYRSYVW